MKKKKLKRSILTGVIIAIINFILLFVAMKYGMGRGIDSYNLGAFCLLSVIIGVLSAAFFFMKPRAGFYLFQAGLLSGFIVMFHTFSRDLNGWEDLTGMISFFMLATGGFIVGAIVQVILLIYRKIKKKKEMKLGQD